MINRKRFYEEFRKQFPKFKRLTVSQVEGFEAIFDEWELWLKRKWVDNDLRKLAYIIATDWHEGGYTMQPVKERGGNAYFIKLYWTNQRKAKELGNLSAKDAVDFCGKGKPQITGRANYTRMGKILGYPLDKNPDLMFDMKIATEVMFEGMLTGRSFKGDFTGKHLGNYFNGPLADPINARRIINGTDKAVEIAEHYNRFLKCLTL